MLAPNPQLPTEAPTLHDVTIVRKRQIEYACVEPVPPEEFGISRNARCIRDAGYVFHEMARSESELIEEGYDEDQIRKLPTYVDTVSETGTRDTVDESDLSGDGSLNRANRLVKITEHYVRMDYEGSGKAKLYRVCTGGDDSEVLIHNGEPAVVEEEYICFAAMTPVIVTHRFFGKSIADLVMDIQKIKTALTRGLLDHLYRANNPRPVVEEASASENTLDDLLLSRHGAPIRVKANAASAVVWQQIPDISGAVYPALQYFDATREWRTGVSRQGQGVDPNALQNQVATIANQMFNTAQAKMKLIARIFAETGIRDLFSLLHATIRKHGSQAQTVKLRNKWIPVDPRVWKARDDMTINVGLGTGGKTEQIAHMTTIAGLQKELVAAGKINLVSDDNIYNTAKQFTRLVGLKDVNEFFTDPKTVPPPPPPGPDPTKMAELQMKAKIEETQMQADIATQRDKTQMDAQLKDREFQHKAALDERKFELERELKILDAQIKREQHVADLQGQQQKLAMDAEHKQRTGEMDERIANRKMALEHDHELDDKGNPMPNKQLSLALEGMADAIKQSHETIMKAVTAARKTTVHRDPKTNRVTHATSEAM